MPYSIEQLGNWRMRLGNAGHFASLGILISCFLSLFLLHAELVQAKIVVSPQSVHVTVTTEQTDEIERTISFFDDGGAAFNWTASWDQGWMSLDPTSGNATAGSSNSTTLTILPEGLPEGTYNGNVIISAGSDNETVSVTLDIQALPPAPAPGSVVVSPGELQFYVTQEQLANPEPITVQVKGTNSTGEITDFYWVASKSDQWIILNGNADSIAESNYGSGSFTVGIDINQLLENQNIYGGNVTIYDGNVTVTATVSTDPDTIPTTSIGIPVRVYVNALRYAAEKSLVTTDWLDLIMNVPVMEDISGALYVLAEHPSLAPGQVFAYRWDSVNGTRFDLFSQWGHPVAGAEDLFYAADIQNTPIAIPFSSDEDTGDPVIPYDPTDVSGTDQTPNIKAFIPITFGGGLRLIGMEGDWIIRAMVGDSSDITNWQSWRELLYYVLHIRPVTGTWIVTEEFDGKSYTYIDDTGTIYPMILHEERGDLSGGVWISPVGRTPLTVTYANSTDQICDTLAIQGHRLDVSSCVQPGGYEVYFVEPSIWGNVEYLYNITVLDATGGGYLEGTWQYRFAGEANWSRPEDFSAVRQEVVIPLDPSCNCYLVNGTVNGYAAGFIVDTGASMVLLSSDDASYMGVDLTDVDQCPFEGTGSGVGGDISVTYCYVDIEIEERLSINNLLVGFSDDWSGPGLLGVPFLEQFHVSTNAEDGTMIIAP
ncbi:MAG: aspartyl protease family protein [Dissulfuribacterales bacterium]